MSCCLDPEYNWQPDFDYTNNGLPRLKGTCINCGAEVQEVWTNRNIIVKEAGDKDQ